jgi:flagellar basal body-associated protein FliL
MGAIIACVVAVIVGGLFVAWQAVKKSKAPAEKEKTEQKKDSSDASVKPAPSPAPAPTAPARSWGWIWLIIIIIAVVFIGRWVWYEGRSVSKTTTAPQATAPKSSPPYYKNAPYTEQEIAVMGFSEKYNVEKVDDSTLRIKKGGSVKYKFCIKEGRSPGEVWMLNFAMYAEKATPGEKKEVAIFQVNGTSQENRLLLGWLPDHEKNARGNITINPGATIGGCENEFSLDALTGPIILKGPIRIIRRM